MTARNHDDSDPLSPSECAAALEALHRWLDRESLAIPPDVAAHVTLCPDCGGRFAASGQLAVALIPSESIDVPPLLTERLLAGLRRDTVRQRRARRMSLAGAGIAAGLVVAVWLIRPPAGPPAEPGPQRQEIVKDFGPPPPDLRAEFAGAGEAVAALTRRAAADAVGAGRLLVPTGPPPVLPPPIAEPTRPLGEAGAALADGFEPVATSARRAAQMIWRELALDDDKK
jgi:hypothetical protein